MTTLDFPFLDAMVLIPLLAAGLVGRLRDARRAQVFAAIASGLALLASVGAWLDFAVLHASVSHPSAAQDRWSLGAPFADRPLLVVDELSAPLLPMIALLFFLTILTTQRTKLHRFPFGWTLASLAILLATFACREPWPLIALLAAGTVSPYLELRSRGRPTRLYVLHMALFVGSAVLGQALVSLGEGGTRSVWVLLPLIVAVLIRSGMAPFHVWMTDLFEHATFGTALRFVAPIPGAYLAVRLLLPVAPDWVMRSLGLIALATAVYAAGMCLVQREARRFFCYLFLSHSALVLGGLEIVTHIGLTGALCVWLSVGLALGGLGLTLRALEARFGRLSLADFHGLYAHTPALAVCFAITGLTAAGFPGTLGFIGTEMLVDGVVATYSLIGIALPAALALNGIAVIRAYFLLFTGARHASTMSLGVGWRERIALLTLAALLLGGGLYPQPGVASRHEAAGHILRDRRIAQMAVPAEEYDHPLSTDDAATVGSIPAVRVASGWHDR